MAQHQSSARKFSVWSASLLAAGSIAFSPILFPAVASNFSNNIKPLMAGFTPAGVDSRLAKKYERQFHMVSSSRFPFTPAGMENGRGRVLTVAARTDSLLVANAISVRNVIGLTDLGAPKTVRLDPSDYRLSSARGWQGFALPKTEKLAPQAPLSDLAARGNFRLDDTTKKSASRFSTSMKLDQAAGVTPSPRGNAASGDYKVDLGGSFSISRKIDVTAGVRYHSERDRLIPQASNAQDSEAVYVGTKIRF